MPSPEPEVVIVVEGGVVTAVATKGPGFPYRIIDIDAIKSGEQSFGVDYNPDATGIDIEEYSKSIIDDVRNDKEDKTVTSDSAVTCSRMTFGTCTHCGKNPAVRMPLKLCTACADELAGLPPGSQERKDWLANGVDCIIGGK